MTVLLGGLLSLALPFLCLLLFGWWGLWAYGFVCLVFGIVGAAIAWDHEPLWAFLLAFGAWPWLVVEWLLG